MENIKFALMTAIKEINNRDIDREKWDACVSGAKNGRIYALSWYLDIVAPNWTGLVKGDYEFVMPINLQKKMGFRYILQPVYAQQHGIFPTPPPDVMHALLQKTTSLARYIQLALNAGNKADTALFEKEQKDNFVLSMDNTYENTRSNYNKHNKRYIKKAHKLNQIKSDLSVEDYIKLKTAATTSHIKAQYIETLKKIIATALEKGIGAIYGSFTPDHGLCGAAFFIEEPHRFTYLNGVSNTEGHQSRAMFALIDHFIQAHAGHAKKLDFEGSLIPGVARFFKGFGANLEPYTVLKKNKLPYPVKWIKR